MITSWSSIMMAYPHLNDGIFPDSTLFCSCKVFLAKTTLSYKCVCVALLSEHKSQHFCAEIILYPLLFSTFGQFQDFHLHLSAVCRILFWLFWPTYLYTRTERCVTSAQPHSKGGTDDGTVTGGQIHNNRWSAALTKYIFMWRARY